MRSAGTCEGILGGNELVRQYWIINENLAMSAMQKSGPAPNTNTVQKCFVKIVAWICALAAAAKPTGGISGR
jgi:hypothetical protein